MPKNKCKDCVHIYLTCLPHPTRIWACDRYDDAGLYFYITEKEYLNQWEEKDEI